MPGAAVDDSPVMRVGALPPSIRPRGAAHLVVALAAGDPRVLAERAAEPVVAVPELDVDVAAVGQTAVCASSATHGAVGVRPAASRTRTVCGWAPASICTSLRSPGAASRIQAGRGGRVGAA